MNVRFGVTPVQVDIYLKNGEKISIIDHFENPDSLDPQTLCEQRIESCDCVFKEKNTYVATIFGTLIVNSEDISAIKFSPYFGK